MAFTGVDALSSTSLASSSADKEEKLLQVDIYPLSSPQPAAGVENDVNNDQMDRLARHFSTTSMFDVEVPLCNAPDHCRSRHICRRRVRIDRFRDSAQMADIMRLIDRELSEPYSFYTYLYFIHQWPDLCVLAIDCDNEAIVGAILCKLDRNALDERNCILSRGYIGMLAVEESYRGHGIGTRLIQTVVELLRQQGCHEVVLETEVSNARSLSLYGRLGFIRDARLFRYYLNAGDAFRLKLFLDQPPPPPLADDDDDCTVADDGGDAVVHHPDHLHLDDDDDNDGALLQSSLNPTTRPSFLHQLAEKLPDRPLANDIFPQSTL